MPARRKKALALIHFCSNVHIRRQRRCRRKPSIMLHDEQGVFNDLLRELQLEGSLRNYLRMTKEQYQHELWCSHNTVQLKDL